MGEKKALRVAFTGKLEQLAADHHNLYVVTSDARGSVGLTGFFEKYPEKAIEVGIAEQNSIGIAAGMASCQNKVFACGPASFLSARSLEQIKIDVCYSQTNVAVVGVSGGISYGALGFSHHSLHDIAVMRTFPGMDVIIPSDAVQMAAITETLYHSKTPAYVRMGRNPVPVLYAEGTPFEIGKASVLKEGDDVLIIACGELVAEAIAASELLKKDGIQTSLLDMHTIKPLDTDAILKYVHGVKAVVTVEEHSVFGGLSGAVSEFLIQNHPVRTKILGLPDETVITGKSAEVFRHYGLDGEGLYKQIKNTLQEGLV